MSSSALGSLLPASQVHDFSKFLHACAGLMPDLVRAVPAWVDDPAVQKSLYANVLANQDLAVRETCMHAWSS